MDEIGVWGQTMTKGLNVLQIILIIFWSFTLVEISQNVTSPFTTTCDL
jgi:hypothetical protein